MLPVNVGGHTAYQNTFVSEFLKLYPDPFTVPKSTWDTIVKFWYLDLSETDTILAPFYPSSGKPVNGANCFASPLCMLSLVVSLSMILPASGLFMISSTDCGSLIKIIILIR